MDKTMTVTHDDVQAEMPLWTLVPGRDRAVGGQLCLAPAYPAPTSAVRIDRQDAAGHGIGGFAAVVFVPTTAGHPAWSPPT